MGSLHGTTILIATAKLNTTASRDIAYTTYFYNKYVVKRIWTIVTIAYYLCLNLFLIH